MLARWEVGAQNCAVVNCMLEQVWELIMSDWGDGCVYIRMHTQYLSYSNNSNEYSTQIYSDCEKGHECTYMQ